MHRLWPRARLIIKFASYYLLVLFLPLMLILTYFYPQQIRQLSDRMLERLQDQNQHIHTLAEAQLESIYALPTQLTSNTRLTNYALSQGAFQEIEAVDEIKKLASSNRFLYDVIFYSMEQDTLYTTSRLIRMPLYATWRNSYRYLDWNPEKFEDYLKSCVKMSILPPQRFQMSDASSCQVITFVFPLSQYQKNRNIAMLLVREDDFRQFLGSKGAWEQGNTLFLDANGLLIASRREESSDILDGLSALVLTNGSIESAQSIAGSEYLFCASRSGKSGGYYISYLSMEAVAAEAQQTRSEILLILAILISAECVLISLFTRKNYAPIRRLSHNATHYLSKEKPKDEFDAIDRAIRNLADSNQLLNQQMDETLPARVNHHLHRALAGAFTSIRDFNQAGEPLNITFDYNAWLVAALSAISETDLCNRLLLCIHDADLQEDIQMYATAVGRRNVVIIITCQNADKGAEKALREIHAQVEEELGVPTLLGISAPCYDLAGLSLAYGQALGVLEALEVGGSSAYLCADVLSAAPFAAYDYPVDVFYRLHIAIARHNVDEIPQLSEDLCSFLEHPQHPAYYLRTIYRNAMVALLRPMVGVKEVMQRYAPSLYDAPYDLKFWQQNLKQCASELCEAFTTLKQSGREQLVSGVLDYVETHYQGYDFSIHKVSEHFKMTASSFSHFFKTHIGISFKQYVDYLKTDVAKTLLCETKLPLEKVSEQLGYGNVSSFIRAFRRVTNTTPGEYRKNRQS